MEHSTNIVDSSGANPDHQSPADATCRYRRFPGLSIGPDSGRCLRGGVLSLLLIFLRKSLRVVAEQLSYQGDFHLLAGAYLRALEDGLARCSLQRFTVDLSVREDTNQSKGIPLCGAGRARLRLFFQHKGRSRLGHVQVLEEYTTTS